MFASSSVSLLYNSPSSMDLSKLFVILVAFDSLAKGTKLKSLRDKMKKSKGTKLKS